METYELWANETDLFPGLKNIIREAYSNGPLLREDERPQNSSNRPRNDAFTVILAGKLNRSGIPVESVEGITRNKCVLDRNINESMPAKSDITIRYRDLLISIECKRPQSIKATQGRAAEARKQLSDTNGIIAIDCSAAIRPAEQVLEARTEKKAADFIDTLLVSKVVPVIRHQFRRHIMGAILYTRTPVHTIRAISAILDSFGNPIKTYNLITATTLFFFANPNSPHANAFRLMKDTYLASSSTSGETHDGMN